MSDFQVRVSGEPTELMASKLYEAQTVRQVLEAAEARGVEVRGRPISIFTGFEPRAVREAPAAPGTIAFVFDEQRQRWPELISSAEVVLQAYIGDADRLGPNHLVMPLGAARSFTPLDAPPPSQRAVNAFFSGNLHRGRDDFHRWLSEWAGPFSVRQRVQRATRRTYDHRFAPSYLRFTDGFGQGLNGAAYAQALADAKVVLCPGGSCSVESFRFYEAILAGAVVLGERLPARASFESCPVVCLDEWSEASDELQALLEDERRLDALSVAQHAWYRREAAPQVTGAALATMLGRASR